MNLPTSISILDHICTQCKDLCHQTLFDECGGIQRIQGFIDEDPHVLQSMPLADACERDIGYFHEVLRHLIGAAVIHKHIHV